MRRVWTMAELVQMDRGKFLLTNMALNAIGQSNAPWAWGPFGLGLRPAGMASDWRPRKWELSRDANGSYILEYEEPPHE